MRERLRAGLLAVGLVFAAVGGWLWWVTKRVLEVIGFSTVVDDADNAANLFVKALTWLVSTPSYVPAGIAITATLALLYYVYRHAMTATLKPKLLGEHAQSQEAIALAIRTLELNFRIQQTGELLQHLWKAREDFGNNGMARIRQYQGDRIEEHIVQANFRGLCSRALQIPEHLIPIVIQAPDHRSEAEAEGMWPPPEIDAPGYPTLVQNFRSTWNGLSVLILKARAYMGACMQDRETIRAFTSQYGDRRLPPELVLQTGP